MLALFFRRGTLAKVFFKAILCCSELVTGDTSEERRRPTVRQQRTQARRHRRSKQYQVVISNKGGKNKENSRSTSPWEIALAIRKMNKSNRNGGLYT